MNRGILCELGMKRSTQVPPLLYEDGRSLMGSQHMNLRTARDYLWSPYEECVAWLGYGVIGYFHLKAGGKGIDLPAEAIALNDNV
jgi:hypothetical protein